MSDTPDKKKNQLEYDRAIPKEEHVSDILNLTRLPCKFCGSKKWEFASYSIEMALIDACSDCHDVNEHNDFVKKQDA